MMNLFKSLRKPKSQEFIIVVSGLPRSGTSMMMKMLEAGGLPPLTDNLRIADDDNPKGYYEFERVKKMPDGDISWLDEQTNFSVIYLDFNAMLADPTKYARQVNQFLDNSLNPQEMVEVINPNLYRQRK
jgi:hypothetical protein